MKINGQTILIVLVLLIVMIPTGVVASHILFDRYLVLSGEGCSAYAISMLKDEEKKEEIKPSPTPPKPHVDVVGCKCGGTGKVKSGDGIVSVPCPCGPSCSCKKTGSPKATAAPVTHLLFFGAKWCKPCMQMHNSTYVALKNVGWTFGPDKHIEIIDVDLDEVTRNRYNVSTLPTVIRLVDGKETNRYEGYINGGGISLRVWKGLDLINTDRQYMTN